MEVTYEAIGRCPGCDRVVVLLDIDEPVPAHVGRDKVACGYRGLGETVRRAPVPEVRRTPARPSKAATERPGRGAGEPKKLSKKQRQRAKKAQVAKVVREGNRRLYGETPEPRSTSVKTVSGGLPSLGRG